MLGGRTASKVQRGFRMSASSLIAALGFGLTLVWCMLTSHTNGFASATIGVEALANPRFFYLLGIFLLAVAFMAAPRQLKRADRALRYSMPLVASFGTACYGLAYHQTFLDSGMLAVGGLFVVGVSFFWFLTRYSLLLARTQDFACVVWAVAFALVFKLPVVAAFNVLASPETLFVAAVALPVVSALVFEAACARVRAEVGGAGASSKARTVYGVPAKPRAAAPSSPTFRRNMLVLLAVSAVLLAVIRSVSDLGMWGAAAEGRSLAWTLVAGTLVPAAVIAAFAQFALIRMAEFTLTMRFQPALLLVMAGLFVVALQANPENGSLPFLADVIRIDELCAHLLFWTVVVTALDALDLPSYRVVGIAEACFASASIAWMLLFGATPIVNNVYVLVATYLVVIVAVYATWLGGRRHADEPEEAKGRPARPSTARLPHHAPPGSGRPIRPWRRRWREPVWKWRGATACRRARPRCSRCSPRVARARSSKTSSCCPAAR